MHSLKFFVKVLKKCSKKRSCSKKPTTGGQAMVLKKKGQSWLRLNPFLPKAWPPGGWGTPRFTRLDHSTKKGVVNGRFSFADYCNIISIVLATGKCGISSKKNPYRTLIFRMLKNFDSDLVDLSPLRIKLKERRGYQRTHLLLKPARVFTSFSSRAGHFFCPKRSPHTFAGPVVALKIPGGLPRSLFLLKTVFFQTPRPTVWRHRARRPV